MIGIVVSVRPSVRLSVRSVRNVVVLAYDYAFSPNGGPKTSFQRCKDVGGNWKGITPAREFSGVPLFSDV